MKNLLKKQIIEIPNILNTSAYYEDFILNGIKFSVECDIRPYMDDDQKNFAMDLYNKIIEGMEYFIYTSEKIEAFFTTDVKHICIYISSYIDVGVYRKGEYVRISSASYITDAELIRYFGEDITEVFNFFFGDEYFYPEKYYCYYDNDSFNNMELSHGLDTGYCDHIDDCYYRTPVEKLYDIVSNPEWEICCSHGSQQIGAAGVLLTATNLTVCNRDMRSRLICIEDEDVCTSRRYVNGMHTKDREGNSLIVKSIDEYSLEKWDHTEHIVCMPTIKSIWIKEWVLNDPDFDWRYKPLLDYAEEHNLKVEVVKARREH